MRASLYKSISDTPNLWVVRYFDDTVHQIRYKYVKSWLAGMYTLYAAKEHMRIIRSEENVSRGEQDIL